MRLAVGLTLLVLSSFVHCSEDIDATVEEDIDLPDDVSTHSMNEKENNKNRNILLI